VEAGKDEENGQESNGQSEENEVNEVEQMLQSIEKFEDAELSKIDLKESMNGAVEETKEIKVSS
jgi:ribosomal 50S subunit-associated protein YjgA (DUF615 family)